MSDKIKAGKIKAGNFYRNKDFLCSEAIFRTVNDYLDRPLPVESVRVVSGLPIGIGGSGCVCGALSGGVIALGLALGRSNPGEDNEEVLSASKELHDWFKSSFRSTCCRVLVKDYDFDSQERVDHCIYLTEQVCEKVLKIIENYGKI